MALLDVQCQLGKIAFENIEEYMPNATPPLTLAYCSLGALADRVFFLR